MSGNSKLKHTPPSMITKLFVDMGMALDRIVVPVILCIVGITVLNSTSSTPFLVFSVINTIILCLVVSIVGTRKPSSAEFDKVSPFLPLLFDGGGETQDDCLENATDDEVDEGGDGNCKSLCCTKDESDDNVDEITTQEQEESDDKLKTRIENFIAKVYKGWIEESRWENCGIDASWK